MPASYVCCDTEPRVPFIFFSFFPSLEFDTQLLQTITSRRLSRLIKWSCPPLPHRLPLLLRGKMASFRGLRVQGRTCGFLGFSLSPMWPSLEVNKNHHICVLTSA